jgi:hypothetical protein
MSQITDPFGLPCGAFERLRLRQLERTGALRWQRLRRATLLLLLIPALYLLTVGPAYLLYESGYVTVDQFEQVYAPVLHIARGR